MTDLGYALINTGLSGLIGFMIGAVYGMRSGKRAGQLEGWIKANQEILDRVKNRKADLSKPFVYHSQVLVIEDNDDAREILASVLKTYGYNVHEAATGREGLRILDRHEIHSVLIDIMLPDSNGYNIAKSIREKNNQIRLIALTGYEIDHNLAMESGFDVHLKKPYQISDVIKALVITQE